MTTARVISGVAVTDQGLLVDLDLGRLLVSWSSTGVLRLRMLLPSDDGRSGFVPELEPGFVGMDPDVLKAWRADLGARQPGDLDVPLDSRHRLRIEQQPLRLTLSRESTVLWQSLPGRTLRVDGLRRRWLYHVRHDGDLFYGLGEKTGALVRNSRSFQLKGVDAAGYDPRTSDPLYKHIPFYLVHRPYSEVTIGVFLNNAWPARFDFGAERSAYWPGYASICVDGGDLDLFLLTGPRPADVLRQYHALTGFPALPTKASLGYLGSTMLYTELDEGCDDAVLGFVDACAEEGIPVSGFHLSSGYTKGADGRRYTLTWNPRGFPDPQGFVDRFIQAGLVLAPNVKPAMLTSHPLWARFDEAAAFIRSGDGSSATEQFWGGRASLVDFSNPAARGLWRAHLTESLINLGVSAIWNDNNEFELDDESATCDNDGRPVPADSMRPWLANLMARAAWEAVREAGDARPFLLSRAGFAGLQKYAQTWSGDNTSDWADLHWNIATMLGMSLSGMPFNGMDAGGFTGPAPRPELFARWVQNAVFHPRFCIHSVNSDNTVTEPWTYPRLTMLVRAAIRLRYALLPTIYSAAAQAHEHGLPVVRPLVFEFPEFAPGFDRHTEFLLGSALLVVAVTAPDQDQVEVCFPPGEWTCFYTGTREPGGRMARVPSPPERSPLYYRTGHGFFLDSRHLDGGPDAPTLIARLATRAAGAAHLYDDDGSTRANEAGVCLHATYEWARTTHQVRLTHEAEGSYVPEWNRLRLELDIGPICPRQVTWSWTAPTEAARRLPQSLRDDVTQEWVWHYDVEGQRLVLELPASAIVRSWQLSLDVSQSPSVSGQPSPPLL